MTTRTQTSWTGWIKQMGRWTPAPPRGIDLGDGRILGAEDVLEGHFRRLASRPRSQNVHVQVSDDLAAAITVLAPDLAPLTIVAEEVADAVPLVQPAPDFRQHLHQALERTHRQHAAQRTLGTRPTPAPSTDARPATQHMAALITLLVVLVVAWRWWTQRSTAPVAA